MVGSYFIIIDDYLWRTIKQDVFSRNFYNFDKTIYELCKTNQIYIEKDYIEDVIIKFPNQLTNEEIETIILKDPWGMLYKFYKKNDILHLRILKSSINYLSSYVGI